MRDPTRPSPIVRPTGQLFGNPVRILAALLLCFTAAAPAGAGEPVPSDEPVEAHGPSSGFTLQGLAFMTGCWQGALGDSGQTVRECFSLADGHLMLGNSQTFTDGTTTFFEFVRVEASSEGIHYVPYPGGTPSVPFRLVSLKDGRAVFENLEHDFPQRIVYQARDGGLLARIEGEVGGKLRAQEFPMDAVPCERGERGR